MAVSQLAEINNEIRLIKVQPGGLMVGENNHDVRYYPVDLLEFSHKLALLPESHFA